MGLQILRLLVSRGVALESVAPARCQLGFAAAGAAFKAAQAACFLWVIRAIVVSPFCPIAPSPYRAPLRG